jgi:DNA-binding transcriptional MerR regulator
MAQSEDETDASPVYPISTVSERTGIGVPTLRQWENRYGFPDPERTEGGHRRYSEADVQALVSVKRWIDEGASVSAAVDRYRSAESRGSEDPVRTVERLIEALLAGGTGEAKELFDRAREIHPVTTVLCEIVHPVLEQLGDAWIEGEATVADEHLATAFLRGRLERLLAAYPLETEPQAAVATLPGERHEMGALSAAILLRQAGTPVAYLGPDLPLGDLSRFMEERSIPVLVLSAPQAEPIEALPERALAPIAEGVYVGGRAVDRHDERVRELGADPIRGGLSDNVGELADRIG